MKIFKEEGRPMDKRSFEQLYMDLLPGLYRLAQSILRNSSDAQDAVHQAVVKAWGGKG